MASTMADWGGLANSNIDSDGPVLPNPVLGFVPRPNLRARSLSEPTRYPCACDHQKLNAP